MTDQYSPQNEPENTPQPSGQPVPQPQMPAATAPGARPDARPDAAKTVTATATIVAVTAAVGGLVLLGVGASAAYAVLAPDRFSMVESLVDGGDFDETLGADGSGATTMSDADGQVTQTVDVSEVTSLDLDIEAAAFNLQFADVAEAQLEVSGPRADAWVLGVEGTELTVETPDRGLVSGCFVNCGSGAFGGATATLTLPQWMDDEQSLNVEASLQGGTLTAVGTYRGFDVDVEAGELRLDGSARSLSLDLEAGKANVVLADVAALDLGVEAGSAKLELTGKLPDRVDIEASTGSAVLRLPAGDYRVDEQSELGKIDNRLTVDQESKHVVSVRAEAAQVTLR